MPSLKYERAKKKGIYAISIGNCFNCINTPIDFSRSKKFCKNCVDYRIRQRNRDKEKRKIRAKIWNHSHPDRVKDLHKKWVASNPNKQKEYTKKYINSHLDKVYHSKHLQRVRHRNIEGVHTLKEWKSLCDVFGNVCLWCRKKKKLTIDHVVPIIKSGTGWITNIQPLCHSCNSKKGARILDFRPFGNIIMDWT